MNIFEAARDAGVPVFVSASSAQVYMVPVLKCGRPARATARVRLESWTGA